jgi:hypothetical protein
MVSILLISPGSTPTLQRQNAENLKQIFPKKEYRGLSPNFHIHVSVSKLYIRWVCLFCWRKYVDWSWEYINRSQTHECRNWGWGRAIPRKGIYKRNCRCSVLSSLKVFARNWIVFAGKETEAQTSLRNPGHDYADGEDGGSSEVGGEDYSMDAPTIKPGYFTSISFFF